MPSSLSVPSLLCSHCMHRSLFRGSVKLLFPARSRALSSSSRTAMAALQRSAFFEAIQKHDPESTAVVHCMSGRTFKYGSLLHDVAASKSRLLRATGKNERTIVGERIAFVVENGYDYVGALAPMSNETRTPRATLRKCVLIPSTSNPPDLPRIQCHSCPSRTGLSGLRTEVHPQPQRSSRPPLDGEVLWPGARGAERRARQATHHHAFGQDHPRR